MQSYTTTQTVLQTALQDALGTARAAASTSSTSAAAKSASSYTLLRHYPTITDFAKRYHPGLLTTAINPNKQLIFVESRSPTITDMEEAYGANSVKTWMMAMLKPTFGTSAVDTDVRQQMDTIVDICFERFACHKATVWMLFCALCYAHVYKISYGTIRTDAMLDAVGEFFKDLAALERQARELREKEERLRRNEEVKIAHYDTWRYLSSRGRLRAAWEGVRKHYADNGHEKALKRSMLTDDCYNADIQILFGMRIIWLDQHGKVVFSQQRYEEVMAQMTRD